MVPVKPRGRAARPAVCGTVPDWPDIWLLGTPYGIWDSWATMHKNRKAAFSTKRGTRHSHTPESHVRATRAAAVLFTDKRVLKYSTPTPPTPRQKDARAQACAGGCVCASSGASSTPRREAGRSSMAGGGGKQPASYICARRGKGGGEGRGGNGGGQVAGRGGFTSRRGRRGRAWAGAACRPRAHLQRWGPRRVSAARRSHPAP